MSCCCTKVYRICQPVGTCEGDKVVFPVNASGAGAYKLSLDFLGVEYSMTVALEDGDPIEFATDKLNENYTFTGKLYKDDAEFLFTVEDIEYDCIEFATKVKYQL